MQLSFYALVDAYRQREIAPVGVVLQPQHSTNNIMERILPWQVLVSATPFGGFHCGVKWLWSAYTAIGVDARLGLHHILYGCVGYYYNPTFSVRLDANLVVSSVVSY